MPTTCTLLQNTWSNGIPDRFIQVSIAGKELFGIAGLALEVHSLSISLAAFASRRAWMNYPFLLFCQSQCKKYQFLSAASQPTETGSSAPSHRKIWQMMRFIAQYEGVWSAAMSEDLRAGPSPQRPGLFPGNKIYYSGLFDASHTFEWGKGSHWWAGTDITCSVPALWLLFCGLTARNCWSRNRQSMQEVVHLASIKPIDKINYWLIARKTRLHCCYSRECIPYWVGAGKQAILERSHPVLYTASGWKTYLLKAAVMIDFSPYMKCSQPTCTSRWRL